MQRFRFLFVALTLFAGTLAAQPGYTVKLTLASQSACTNSPALSLATDASASSLGSGAGAFLGRATISDFSVTRISDDCSIALFRGLFLGTRLQTVTIAVFSGPTEVLRFTLSNAAVTGVSESESLNGAPTEKVAFTFDRIEILDVLTTHFVIFDKRF
jgi:type VI protein secretion system component Hcp